MYTYLWVSLLMNILPLSAQLTLSISQAPHACELNTTPPIVCWPIAPADRELSGLPRCLEPPPVFEFLTGIHNGKDMALLVAFEM
ncbi:hypothetical protein F5X97DRAFT_295066 [Nemania serpens]|nr:hypothetical protein F5X97DRAFT_295066 [Nemania serpens]